VSSNFGAAAGDYARFRAGFPDSMFERLAAAGFCSGGMKVVDVGTGTGTMARGYARRGADVIAIDPDERLTLEARQLDAAENVRIDYRKGKAEELPAADATADVITAGQCWHWFHGRKAAAEFARVVRPGGGVVIAHFDWLPLPGNLVEATERLIKAHNASWRFDGGNGFHAESLPHLHAAGFRDLETFSYDVDVAYSAAAWRGRIRASAGVGATLAPEQVQAFDADLERTMNAEFPGDRLLVPHRVFVVMARAGRNSR